MALKLSFHNEKNPKKKKKPVNIVSKGYYIHYYLYNTYKHFERKKKNLQKRNWRYGQTFTMKKNPKRGKFR